MSDDWNSVCKEWLADTQWVSAGGIVSCEDGALYACDDENIIYQCEHDKEVLNDDMSSRNVHIVEPETFVEALKNNGRTSNGLWLAEKKYTFCSVDTIDGLKTLTFARPGGGLYLSCTGNGFAVLSVFESAKGHDKSNSLSTTVNFAKYLSENGY